MRVLAAAGVLLCTACSGLPPGAGEADAGITVAAGPARLEQGVTSVRARRDAGVVRQGHDYSCGSAALATLLRHGMNEDVSEQQLLGELLHTMSEADITLLQQKGLSLAALRQLAQLHGHRAQGFRIHQSQLGKVRRPVIVHVRPGGYEHFAVLKLVQGDTVYLADPSLGNVRMPLYRFLDMWADEQGYGVLLAVEPAEGRWPEHYALQVEGSADREAEANRVLRLGNPYGPAAQVNPAR